MANHASNSGPVQLSNGSYDVLRRIVEKVLPGIGVLYTAFAVLWHWGYTTEVVGSLAALAVFGGLLLSLARSGYQPTESATDAYDGALVKDEASGTYRLQLLDTTNAEDLINKKTITFKGLNSV